MSDQPVYPHKSSSPKSGHKRHKYFDSSIPSLLGTTVPLASQSPGFDIIPEQIPRAPELHREQESTSEQQQEQKHKKEKEIDKELNKELEKEPEIQTELNKQRQTVTDSVHTSDKKHANKNVDEALRQILGISTDEWPYSEGLLSSTVSLRTEIEKTKREETKLRTIESSLELLKYAISSGVPPNLVPYIFLNGKNAEKIRAQGTLEHLSENLKPVKEQRGSGDSSNATSVFKVNIPQSTQFEFHHWQGPEDEKIGTNSTDTTVHSQSQINSVAKSSSAEDRKRKIDDFEPEITGAVGSNKPSTPKRILGPRTHRRHQSEANVSQLRSIYESQILDHQRSQKSQRSQKPPVKTQNFSNQALLRSPYRNPSELQNHTQQHAKAPFQTHLQYAPLVAPQVHYVQGPPPSYQFPGPHTVQIPGGSIPHIITQSPMRPVLPGSNLTSPYPYQQVQVSNSGQSPYPKTSLYSQHTRNNSENESPTKSKGKSDVSFLISTPNNPPK